MPNPGPKVWGQAASPAEAMSATMMTYLHAGHVGRGTQRGSRSREAPQGSAGCSPGWLLPVRRRPGGCWRARPCGCWLLQLSAAPSPAQYAQPQHDHNTRSHHVSLPSYSAMLSAEARVSTGTPPAMAAAAGAPPLQARRSLLPGVGCGPRAGSGGGTRRGAGAALAVGDRICAAGQPRRAAPVATAGCLSVSRGPAAGYSDRRQCQNVLGSGGGVAQPWVPRLPSPPACAVCGRAQAWAGRVRK